MITTPEGLPPSIPPEFAPAPFVPIPGAGGASIGAWAATKIKQLAGFVPIILPNNIFENPVMPFKHPMGVPMLSNDRNTTDMCV